MHNFISFFETLEAEADKRLKENSNKKTVQESNLNDSTYDQFSEFVKLKGEQNGN